ncbi:MAG: hypothetical protein GXO31_07305, partial [Epsilonproteobacteria bacterium]|nr:hypothetical protein [Campylobacterota bacterium]
MNKYLEQLVELSKINKEIDDFTPRIEAIKKEWNDLSAEEESLKNKIAQIDEEIED